MTVQQASVIIRDGCRVVATRVAGLAKATIGHAQRDAGGKQSIPAAVSYVSHQQGDLTSAL